MIFWNNILQETIKLRDLAVLAPGYAITQKPDELLDLLKTLQYGIKSIIIDLESTKA